MSYTHYLFPYLRHVHSSYEFGGPIGVTAMMTLFPVLMYYLWICLAFNDGQLAHPDSIDDIRPFALRMWSLVKEVNSDGLHNNRRLFSDHFMLQHASPTWYTFNMYTGFAAYQLFLAFIIPGYIQEGLPVPSLGYKTLKYNCNALGCWYTSIITFFLLHHYHIFRITELIDNFGSVMTVAMFWGFAVSFITYFWAVATGNAMRMSGNFAYDLFMGAALNPRLGSVDLKMWAEVRIPWLLLFGIAVSGGTKQYETYGYISPVSFHIVRYLCLIFIHTL
jgi:Delta24(24(1))-sterol reductase